MFKTPCPACCARIAAALDHERVLGATDGLLNVHCPHNGVGATLSVQRGLVVDWNLFPARTEAAFRALIERTQAAVQQAASARQAAP